MMNKVQTFEQAFRAVEFSIRASDRVARTIEGTAQHDEAMDLFNAWDREATKILSSIHRAGLDVEYGQFAAERWAEEDVEV